MAEEALLICYSECHMHQFNWVPQSTSIQRGRKVSTLSAPFIIIWVCQSPTQVFSLFPNSLVILVSFFCSVSSSALFFLRYADQNGTQYSKRGCTATMPYWSIILSLCPYNPQHGVCLFQHYCTCISIFINIIVPRSLSLCLSASSYPISIHLTLGFLFQCALPYLYLC